jgi:cytochrome c
MRTRFVVPGLIGIAAAFTLALPQPAAASEAMIKEKGCTACHALDKKGVGPAYKEVAKKYKGNKDAEALLATSILKGSTGKFGPVPMPPNKVTDAEAKALAAWVLTL